MPKMLSACGVWCSDCPAYQGLTKGTAHQKRTADAWQRIYGLTEAPENISCGGCMGDDEVFHTSRGCKARLCCRGKGLANCGECDTFRCPDLEKAQSVWDEVPDIGAALTRADFVTYAQPYCGHRQRLNAVRAARTVWPRPR